MITSLIREHSEGIMSSTAKKVLGFETTKNDIKLYLSYKEEKQAKRIFFIASRLPKPTQGQ